MIPSRLALDSLDPARTPPLEESLARARRLVSDRVGVISDVVFVETTAEEPAVFWAQSRPAELAAIAGRSALNAGNATSIDQDRAVMKAVGESVERYCCAIYDDDQLVSASHDEIGIKAVRPETFALFSERQYQQPDFPFSRFTRSTPVRWTLGHSFVENGPMWVPASFVYIPYERGPEEPPMKDLISTGLACGPTLAVASLKALCEAVERDAYTIVWQNRLSRPHIDLQAIDDPVIQRLLQALRRITIEPHAVLLTLDIPIPVILMVMTRPSGPPWTIVASAADLSPRHALLLALEEACLALIGMGRAFAADHGFRAAADCSNVTTLPLHGLAHAADARFRSSVDFLIRPSEIVTLADLRDVATGNPVTDLETALQAVRPRVSEIVGVDVTTSDIDDVGFKVVRVVVPDLQPMDINHNHRHLGGRRLYEVPSKIGFKTTPSDETHLNDTPHPFP
jgi:ribosomal protein S12 methylthiotransferase accessory factor